MPHLYELAEQYRVLVDTLETSGDTDREATDFAVAISQLKDSLEGKAVNVSKAVINYLSDAEVVEMESRRLIERAERARRMAERLREYLKREMELAGIAKIKRPEVTIAIMQNPPRVNILDELLIPAAFWRIVPETRQVDKRLILEKAKLGEAVAGVAIEASTRLSIR